MVLFTCKVILPVGGTAFVQAFAVVQPVRHDHYNQPGIAP